MPASLQWRHNGRDSVSNHQPHHGLLNGLFRRSSKKTSKLRVTGLCEGNSQVTGNFPAQMASNAENISIWWRHHVIRAPWFVLTTIFWNWLIIGTSFLELILWTTFKKTSPEQKLCRLHFHEKVLKNNLQLDSDSIEISSYVSVSDKLFMANSWRLQSQHAVTSTVDYLVHYNDVIMGTMASPITKLLIVYSTVYSDANQRKYQSSASLAFVRGLRRGPVNSPHKWPVTRKMFPFDDVS